MLIRSKHLIIFLFLALALLSGCGPDTGQGNNPEPPMPTAGPTTGTALLSYTYKIEQAPVFKLEVHPEIPILIEDTDNPNVYTITGIAQAYANLEMLGVGGEVNCTMYCEIPVRYAVTGTLELDELNNNCKLPITILRTYQVDEYIITGGCPDDLMAQFDCVAMAETLVDPNIYTFTKEIRELHMPSAPGVELKAEIKNVIMPSSTSGICDW